MRKQCSSPWSTGTSWHRLLRQDTHLATETVIRGELLELQETYSFQQSIAWATLPNGTFFIPPRNRSQKQVEHHLFYYDICYNDKGRVLPGIFHVYQIGKVVAKDRREGSFLIMLPFILWGTLITICAAISSPSINNLTGTAELRVANTGYTWRPLTMIIRLNTVLQKAKPLQKMPKSLEKRFV